MRGDSFLQLWSVYNPSESRSQSHIATNGQSVSLGVEHPPGPHHDQIFIAVWLLRYCFVGLPL
jgi:hypothetical protein